MKTTPIEGIECALFICFFQERKKGILISGLLIKKNVLTLNNEWVGDKSFVVRTWCLDRFKKHHSIHQLAITGKQLSSDNADVAEYLGTFSNMMAEGNYSPQQINNAD